MGIGDHPAAKLISWTAGSLTADSDEVARV